MRKIPEKKSEEWLQYQPFVVGACYIENVLGLELEVKTKDVLSPKDITISLTARDEECPLLYFMETSEKTGTSIFEIYRDEKVSLLWGIELNYNDEISAGCPKEKTNISLKDIPEAIGEKINYYRNLHSTVKNILDFSLLNLDEAAKDSATLKKVSLFIRE